MKAVIPAILFITSTLVAAEPVEIGPVVLTADAEHYGAYLDKSVAVYFYTSGEFRSGLLKTNYTPRNGLQLQGGTPISFFKNGAVSTATIVLPFRFGNFDFVPSPASFYPDGSVSAGRVLNPAHENIAYAGKADITLSTGGTIETIQPVDPTPTFRLLGRTLQQKATLRFDPQTKLYRLIQGETAGNDTLIGAFVTYRSSIPTSTSNAIAVVVPKGTKFALPEASGRPYETWQVTNSGLPFNFNGWNFGLYPTLMIKNMQLLGVQITQALKIGDYQFNAYDIVYFDGGGKVSPR